MADEYKEGLRDGRIESLERANEKAHDRLDAQDVRLTAQERITYGILGAITLIQVWPAIKGMLDR